MTEAADAELGAGLTCFVVCPIGDRLSPMGSPARLSYENSVQIWERVVQPACEQFGMEPPVRADKISESGEIPEQIFKLLRDSDLVIADLSGGNSNVMYELGLRHSRDMRTIQIGENERLPFDVTTIRTIKFVRTEAGLIDARNALVEAIRAALQGGGSPVTATRVWNEGESLAPAELARASALSSTADDPLDDPDDEDPDGRLELMVAGEESMEVLGALLNDMTGQMETMSQLANDATPKLLEAETFAAKLTITRKFADDLQVPADAMNLSSNQYLHAVEQVDGMMSVVIGELAQQEEPVDDPDLLGFLAAVLTLARHSADASVHVAGFQQQVRELRTSSKQLRAPAKSIEHSLNTVQRGNAIITSWADRLRATPNWVEPPALPDDDEED